MMNTVVDDKTALTLKFTLQEALTFISMLRVIVSDYPAEEGMGGFAFEILQELVPDEP